MYDYKLTPIQIAKIRNYGWEPFVEPKGFWLDILSYCTFGLARKIFFYNALYKWAKSQPCRIFILTHHRKKVALNTNLTLDEYIIVRQDRSEKYMTSIALQSPFICRLIWDILQKKLTILIEGG